MDRLAYTTERMKIQHLNEPASSRSPARSHPGRQSLRVLRAPMDIPESSTRLKTSQEEYENRRSQQTSSADHSRGVFVRLPHCFKCNLRRTRLGTDIHALRIRRATMEDIVSERHPDCVSVKGGSHRSFGFRLNHAPNHSLPNGNPDHDVNEKGNRCTDQGPADRCLAPHVPDSNTCYRDRDAHEYDYPCSPRRSLGRDGWI